MRIYEITPIIRREGKEDEIDYYNSRYAKTYALALKDAKALSIKHGGAEIQFFKSARNGDPLTALELGLMDCLQWSERYENGRQVPAVNIFGRDIWRWGGLNEELKPKNDKKERRNRRT